MFSEAQTFIRNSLFTTEEREDKCVYVMADEFLSLRETKCAFHFFLNAYVNLICENK